MAPHAASAWDDCPDEQQEREIDEILGSDTEEVFFAERPGGGLCGFLEASLRSRADGCDSTPVGYIEGWYVDEDVRVVEWAGRWSMRRKPGLVPEDAARWRPTPSYGTCQPPGPRGDRLRGDCQARALQEGSGMRADGCSGLPFRRSDQTSATIV